MNVMSCHKLSPPRGNGTSPPPAPEQAILAVASGQATKLYLNEKLSAWAVLQKYQSLQLHKLLWWPQGSSGDRREQTSMAGQCRNTLQLSAGTMSSLSSWGDSAWSKVTIALEKTNIYNITVIFCMCISGSFFTVCNFRADVCGLSKPAYEKL